MDLEAVHVKDPDDNPQTVSLELSEAQTDLHEDLGSLSRPLTHPLKIHNLPDEPLMNIFNNIRDRTDIKNLRLSSRRLNETSSHLLMDTLHVSPNPSSLERLDKVSRHPTISRGIRRLVASVDVYNADAARDLALFTTNCILELQAHIPRREHGRFEAFGILKSWDKFRETFVYPRNDGAHVNEHHACAMYNGWLRFKRLHDDQQSILRSGHYTQGIASAVGRMTRLDGLVIKDRSRSCAGGEGSSPSILRKVEGSVTDPTRLVEDLTFYTLSWERARRRGVENQPTRLLYQIPLAIHNAGSSLAHLKFDLTAPHSFQLDMDSDEMTKLRSFAQGLKSFNFSVRVEPKGFTRPIRDALQVENLHKFLTAFTRSENLDSAALDFAFQEKHFFYANRLQDPDRTSIGPVLVDWHQPREVHLKNCAITLEELRAFVGLHRKEPAVLGLWYVYLLDGDWADAAELLRSEVLLGRLSPKSVRRILTVSCFSGGIWST